MGQISHEINSGFSATSEYIFISMEVTQLN